MPAEESILAKAYEIGEKIVHNARYMIPVVGIFFLLKDLWIGFWNLIGAFIEGQVQALILKVKDGIATLGVDLTPSAEFQAFIAKANSVVPLDEAWRLLLVYLAFASVVMGVKWTRNLIPGMS